MAAEDAGLAEVLQQLASTQKELTEALRAKTSGKDAWDKFAALSTFLSSVIIAGAAGWFTHEFDRQQLNVNELTILEKFIPHLASGKLDEQKVSIIELSALGDTRVALQLARLYPNAGTVAGVQYIAKNGNTEDKAAANDTLNTIKASQQLAQLKVPNTWTERALSYIAHDQALELTAVKSGGELYIGYGVDLSSLPGNGFSALRDAGVADPAAVIAGKQAITLQQADELLDKYFVRYISVAKESLGTSVYDRLSGARQYVLVNLMYDAGIPPFKSRLAGPLIAAVNAKNVAEANRHYADAAAVVKAYTSGARVRERNAAMMRTGNWIEVPDPNTVPLYLGGTSH